VFIAASQRHGKRVSATLLQTESVKSVLMLLGLTLLTFVAIRQQSPPSPAPASTPPTEFSSTRAMSHVRAISRQPHPIGSAAQVEVRNYLMRELSALGVTPEIQQTTAVTQKANSPFRAATVHNLIARLPGTDNTKAVLIVGHYDSVSTSYGASDDGAAVAAMLETLRALKAGPALKNDVILLFTDGEEIGLLGAEAFVNEHSLAKNLGLILNFEARGNRGPSIMFESSPQNGRLIAEFARAVEYPIATSFAYEIYRRLPNNTDFTVLKETGVAGLNFAYIDGFTSYHTLLDNAERIDERSLQHHGSNALSLTRHFANLNLGIEPRRDAVYFDLIGLVLVRYSSFFAVALAVLTTGLFIVVAIVGFRQGLLSVSKLLGAFLAFLLCLIIPAFGVTLAWWLVTLVHKNYNQLPSGVPYNAHLYITSFVGLAVCLISTMFLLLTRRIGLLNLAMGASLWWLILMAVTIVFLPGASYLFSWPLLFSLAGLGYYFYSRPEKSVSLKLFAVLILTSIPGIILLAPAIYHVAIALPMVMTGALMILVALTLGLLVPHLEVIGRLNKWVLPVAAFIVFSVFLIMGGLTSGFDGQHPGMNSLFYGLNADNGTAIWGSADVAPDSWTSQFLTNNVEQRLAVEFLPLASNKFLLSQAPVADLVAPEIALLNDNADHGARILRLHITSPRRASIISIYVDRSTEVRGLSVNGKRIDVSARPVPAGSPWAFRYFGLPEEGIELEMEVKPGMPMKIKAVDQSYGLPELRGTSFRARPVSLIPAPYPFTDSTMVSKTFTF
jgi:uncharacterized membrane protein